MSRHICVSQVFSPNYFEMSFWDKIMQICDLNIKIYVGILCQKCVAKNNFMKNVSPTKKGWEPLLKPIIITLYDAYMLGMR